MSREAVMDTPETARSAVAAALRPSAACCAGELPQPQKQVAPSSFVSVRASTSPLVEYYRGQGLLKSVNGAQSMEAVYADVKEALGL